MKDGQQLLSALRQFHGGDPLFFSPMNKSVSYTAGFRHFITHAGGGAYWLLDILITEPDILKAQRELGIVFVRLTVTEDHRCVLVVNADDGEPALYQRDISWTDCPPRPVTEADPKGEWLFYFENSVLMLPGER